MRRTVSGWGRHPVDVTAWREAATRTAAREATRTGEGLIARGNGRAYGDAAIGAATTLSLTGLDRMIRFDPDRAELTCEAGVLLADVIAAVLPRGFFPAVVPGTRFVTVGGAIAADVHGKNHHGEGGFGDHLVDFTLATVAGEVLQASRDTNPELFFATVGGMGLTGTILEATIRLRRVESGWMRQETIVTPDLSAAMAALDGNPATYSVAWIDCLAKGAALGRSLVYLGEHVSLDDAVTDRLPPFPPLKASKVTVPFSLPRAGLSHWSVAAFNDLYFRMGRRKAKAPSHVPLGPYFFPLDGIGDWNRIYGRRGFMQHQCVLPPDRAAATLSEMLARVARRGDASFLAVLKKLGGATGLLSFPREGWTLSLDFPMSAGLPSFLDELDRLVVRAGGRLYLAKDARQSRETFDAGYPEADRFRAFRREIDPDGRLQSRLAQRLGL